MLLPCPSELGELLPSEWSRDFPVIAVLPIGRFPAVAHIDIVQAEETEAGAEEKLNRELLHSRVQVRRKPNAREVGQDILLPGFELLFVVHILQQVLCFKTFTLVSMDCHSLQPGWNIQPINFYLFNCYVHCLPWILTIYFLTCIIKHVFFLYVRLGFFSCRRYYAIKNDLVWIAIFIYLTTHNIFSSTVLSQRKISSVGYLTKTLLTLYSKHLQVVLGHLSLLMKTEMLLDVMISFSIK